MRAVRRGYVAKRVFLGRPWTPVGVHVVDSVDTFVGGGVGVRYASGGGVGGVRRVDDHDHTDGARSSSKKNPTEASAGLDDGKDVDGEKAEGEEEEVEYMSWWETVKYSIVGDKEDEQPSTSSSSPPPPSPSEPQSSSSSSSSESSAGSSFDGTYDRDDAGESMGASKETGSARSDGSVPSGGGGGGTGYDKTVEESFDELKRAKVGGTTVGEAAEKVSATATSSAGKAAEGAKRAAEKAKQAAEQAKKAAEAGAQGAKAFREQMGSKAKEFDEKLGESSEFYRDSKAKASESAYEFASKAGEAANAAQEKVGKEKISGFRQVLAGVFGLKTPRQIHAEESRKRTGGAYEWVEFKDTKGDIMYRNTTTLRVQKTKPADFDERGGVYVEANMDTSDVTVFKAEGTAWDRMASMLRETVVIQGMLDVGEQLKDTSAGKAAKVGREKLRDKKEELQEKWETSQNPIVYNASYAVDSLFSENEQAAAVRAVSKLDAKFDLPEFIEEMTEELVPDFVSAFLQGDRGRLAYWCDEGSMERIGAVLKQREAEKLTFDDTILKIENVEFMRAQIGEFGQPRMLLSAQAQCINCVYNKDMEIVEGGEDEIRAVFYLFALSREWDELNTVLRWKVIDFNIQGSVLYL